MPMVFRLISAFVLVVAVVACDGGAPEEPVATAPMKIGLMLSFRGPSETATERQGVFDLAIRHVNETEGVLDLPLEGVVADFTRDPQTGV